MARPGVARPGVGRPGVGSWAHESVTTSATAGAPAYRSRTVHR
ncbi:hypothetical protein Ae505Ps2_6153 [Pseudonocardia sp. Ae505_Ps2]|nr:hypothetical protein Ae505Ps2_6153 [Pseudonocardia sp. Ae505_Ps2]